MPKRYLEHVDDDFKKHLIGLGPYKFVSHLPGVELVLEAYEGYWRKVPYVKRLIMKGVPEGTLTVAVATFDNQRWRPHLYVGAVVSKSCVCAKNLGPKAPLFALPDAYLFLCYGNPYHE